VANKNFKFFKLSIIQILFFPSDSNGKVLAIHREANFKPKCITADQGSFLAALDSRPNVPRLDDLDILDLPEHRLR
jgi:hypothetical protein